MAGAADELILLERVFLRIGSAETDEQLQNAVQKFLPPVLLKLSSTQEGVRKKVMELLVHINKRIKSRPLVQLPVEALLVQYQDPSATSFITNFTIIYLKLGFPRLSIEKQIELVPTLLNSLEGKPQSHQDSLLLLVIPLLGHVQVPIDPAKRSGWFVTYEKPIVSRQLSSLMLDMLLLPYGAMSQQPSSDATTSGAEVTFPIPPGMTEASFKRVTAENPLKPEELEKIKLGIVKFLSDGVYPEEHTLIHLIVAAADTRFSVANSADLELKKIIGSLDWSSRPLVLPLYALFLGTVNTANVKPDQIRSSPCIRIRLKILHYLCRVTGAGFVIPACFQVIFDSLYGTNTNTRLKTLALNFTANVIKFAPLTPLNRISTVLASGLKKFLNEAEPIHQAQTFILIGDLGQRLPHLFVNDIELLDSFMNRLMTATPDLRLSIREALLNLATAYKIEKSQLKNESDKSKDTSKETKLIELISKCLKSEESIVRFVAVRYAAVVFPSDHVSSRHLLLLACGDSKDEVYVEALKTLYGTTRKHDEYLDTAMDTSDSEDEKLTKTKLPSFSQMCIFISKEAKQRKSDSRKYDQGNHVLPYDPVIYTAVLSYLRLCLVQDAGLPLIRNIPQFPNNNTPQMYLYLKSLCADSQKLKDNHPLVSYVSLIEDFVVAYPGITPISCLLEVIGCIPDVMCPKYSQKIKIFRNFLNSMKEEIREYSSLLYGIMIAHALNKTEYENAIKELILTIGNNKSLESQHGCLLGLAHGLERRLTILKKSGIADYSIESDVFVDGLKAIVNFLDHSNHLLQSAACTGIGIFGRCVYLPLDNDEDDKSKNSKLYVVRILLEIMNNIKFQSRLRERAARSLGLICVGEIFPHTRRVIQGLINTAKETKDVEVHFSVGESLVMCVQSIWSSEARDPWTTAPADYVPETNEIPSDDHLEWLLDELLQLLSEPHPNSRQATCIWLLSLLKQCSQRKPIQTHLVSIQNAFKDLLSENSDIVQDVASKGLGLIYDCCDENMRNEMLDGLLDQLQSGRRTVAQVTSETKLFEEGQLGKSPTGGNLSTYKELCSLASDLNKPDLIYKFMHLANHNAIWNSKKGAAFGFSTIASKAGEQINPHLPKIIPRLYRYQFDPTPNIQNSMQKIWNELVKERQKTLDTYQKEILEDLITNLTANQWRVRQSCCLALQDFLRGGGNRSIHDCISSMNELWSQLFRVMDDVHEGTRIAAGNTTKMLSKLCVRASDVAQGKDGVNMINAILPVLLNVGIINNVSEVRQISLHTVSQLVRSAGSLLKPFLPTLIPALLQATGELESSKLSYLSTMYGAQNQVQEAIDSARASAAISHFTTETIAKCLQYIDVSTVEEIAPKLTDLIKNSVGLGTKIACAHFVTLLVVQIGKEINPYTGKMLAAFLNGLSDRNSAIRKHYATAIGSIVEFANESSLEKLFTKLRNWYFKAEAGSTMRTAIAQTIRAIGNKNQETINNYSTFIFPLVFFAMHEEKTPENESTIELWNDIWSEHSPGTETGIRQHMEEICQLLQEALESSDWTVKSQGANSVSTVATKLGTALDIKYQKLLINILVTGLSGRTWKGKEKLLEALASICSNCKDTVKNDSEINKVELIDAMMRECRKEEIVYKRHALKSIGEVLSALDEDRFEELYTIVHNIIINNNSDSGKTDSDEESSVEETNKRRENMIKLKEIVYESLGKAWPNNNVTQEKYRERFVEHCVLCLPSTVRTVQVSIILTLNQYVSKLILLSISNSEISDLERESLNNILTNLIKSLSITLDISKHMRLRKESLDVVILLLKRLKEKQCIKEFEAVKTSLAHILVEVEKDVQPEVRTRVIEVKSLFKD